MIEFSDRAKELKKCVDEDKISPDMEKFRESISTSDGFWYGINEYFDLKDIVVVDNSDTLTFKQLKEIEKWWQSYSLDI